jgi:hypothetical protein
MKDYCGAETQLEAKLVKGVKRRKKIPLTHAKIQNTQNKQRNLLENVL